MENMSHRKYWGRSGKLNLCHFIVNSKIIDFSMQYFMFKLVNILKYGYVVHKDLNLVQT